MDQTYLSLGGQVALVTGGSRGIGKAIALTFADAGADLAISGRKLPDLEKVAGEITKLGRKCLPVTAHARKVEELKHLVDQVMGTFGHIDILVNNAATNPAMGPLVETDEKIYDHIMETNLKGYFMMSKFAGAIMVKQKRGNIINISSAGGVSPAEGLGPYCISKAGINMLTKALALELGPYNIRVNAIAPRIVKTSFSEALWTNEALMKKELECVPLKRVAAPEEIARTALYLASTASSYMTGHVVVLNGGAFF